MKILQLCNKFPYPANDGGSIAISSITEALVLLKHQVTVFSVSTYKHPANADALPENLRNLVTSKIVAIDTRIKILPLLFNLFFSKKPYNAYRFYSKNFKKSLEEHLLQHKYDVIQIEGLYLLPYIKTIRKMSHARIIYRAHNIEHEIWVRNAASEKSLFKRFYTSILAKRMKSFEISLLNTYDLVLAITSRDKEILNQLGNQRKIHVIPFSINHQQYQPYQSLSQNPVLFYIGALDWKPNLSGLKWFINEVWPEVRKRVPQSILHVAGRNLPANEEEKLKKPGIHYHAEVSNAYEYMKEKGVMIVPLFSGSGMRIKIIEGMAMKKLIISTSIGAEGIGATDQENILIANTREEFIEKTIQGLKQPELISKIGTNANHFVIKNFDTFAFSTKLQSIYTEQINGL